MGISTWKVRPDISFYPFERSLLLRGAKSNLVFDEPANLSTKAKNLYLNILSAMRYSPNHIDLKNTSQNPQIKLISVTFGTNKEQKLVQNTEKLVLPDLEDMVKNASLKQQAWDVLKKYQK